jgi:adenylate cyclase
VQGVRARPVPSAVTARAPFTDFPRIQRRLYAFGLSSNGVGALVVIGLYLDLAPIQLPAHQVHDFVNLVLPVSLAYTAVTLPFGWYFVGRRPLGPVIEWLGSTRPPSAAVQMRVLRYPLNWALHSMLIWLGGVVVSMVLAWPYGAALVVGSIVVVLMGGLTTCALQYLVVERIVRPLTAAVLLDGLPPRTGAPGVRHRLAMAWTLTGGVPLLGIVLSTSFGLAGDDDARHRTAIAALAFGAVGLIVGVVATRIASRSVAEPLSTMQEALARVEEGDFAVQVVIDDGSEVGRLEAGLNRMTAGLAERERLHDAFGRYVDPALTDRVLRDGVDLAGEEVDVSLLFMDVRDFTAWAERASARDVVSTLNGLFEAVVPIVLEHGGHVSKFIGDGLLAVFGAPDRLPDHACRAVAAGRAITDLVRARYGDALRVGVGINSGTAVVGTIGGGGRLDFTVIGDAVNTAARVEAATRTTGDDLLITEATRARLDGAGSGTWRERSSALKGKSEAVRLFAPAR